MLVNLKLFLENKGEKFNTGKVFHPWLFSLHYDGYQYHYLDALKLITCPSQILAEMGLSGN